MIILKFDDVTSTQLAALVQLVTTSGVRKAARPRVGYEVPESERFFRFLRLVKVVVDDRTAFDEQFPKEITFQVTIEARTQIVIRKDKDPRDQSSDRFGLPAYLLDEISRCVGHFTEEEAAKIKAFHREQEIEE